MKILPIALVALVSAPVSAEAVPNETIVVVTDKNELDRVVCEREEQIGSRLGARKVCKTVREWQEQQRVQREEVERVQQQNSGMSGQ